VPKPIFDVPFSQHNVARGRVGIGNGCYKLPEDFPNCSMEVYLERGTVDEGVDAGELDALEV